MRKWIYNQQLSIATTILLEQAQKDKYDWISEYFKKINDIINTFGLRPEVSKEVWDTVNSHADTVKTLLYGSESLASPSSYNSWESPIAGNTENLILWNMTWKEHFKENLPPKYQWVKADGKSLQFFLRRYRGKNENMENLNEGRLDYVDLGMTQADVRRYDNKLMRAIESYCSYNEEAPNLSDVVPSLLSKAITL